MFFDLNLPTNQLSAPELAASLELLQKYGFKAAAQNTVVTKLNALRDSRRTPGLAPEVSQNTSDDSFRVLERLTLVLGDDNLNMKMDVASNPKLNNYDLLAVRPETEKAFAHAANNCDVDIIQLDLSSRLPFYIKKTTVNTAVQKGIFFEVSYAPCIRDQNARRNIIANIQQLLRVTSGKNLILTSDAVKALDLRSPLDILNLAQVFGIPDNCARDALGKNCKSVLFHAATRRDTMKGFVSVEPSSSLSDSVKWKLGDAPTEQELHFETNADFVSFGDLSGFGDDDMDE
ncbi:UNVERIFIED_CONTAM: hypothetical protein HDU68_007549 [Siphonaria sp. JEL0065]|nr:hypothetical protein HDU68_007549 [Siphonaria sp. JEL0065]